MARAEISDLLQNFRFHVTAALGEDEVLDPLRYSGSPSPNGEAGFQSVSLPEISTEATEYREGNFLWTRKFPGVPTASDATLMRGVALTDTSFWRWAYTAITGGEYRATVTIRHYHRTESPEVEGPASAGTALRLTRLNQSFPIRCKPLADLDATSGEVSLAEVDIACESMDISVDGGVTWITGIEQ